MAASLSTLLATRLDAVLGTTLAQHPVLLEGGRPSLPAQPAVPLHGQDNVIRRSAEQVGEAGARAGRSTSREAVGRQEGTAAPGRALPSTVTPSARAILSEPARTLLALLVLPPDPGATCRGAAPLWADRPTVPPQPAGEPSAQTPRTGQGQAAERADLPTTTGGRAATSASSAAAANTAAGGNATASTVPGPPSGSAAATAPGAQAAARPDSAAQGVRLTPAPPGMASTLASTLATQVAHSGLFYESHLAELSFGKRSVEQLLQEPQARLGTSGTQTGAASSAAGGGTGTAQRAEAPTGPTTASTAATSSTTVAQTATQTLLSAAGALLGGASTADAGHATPTPASTPIPGVHPEAAALVRQQLETLANGQFIWQGEAWPGAELDWEIQDEGARPEGGPANTWSSRLQLHLPGLGAIDARLSLAGSQLVLRLEAPDSADLLRTYAPLLRNRLQDTGLVLSDLAIQAQADPDSSEPATTAHPAPSVEEAS